MIKLTPKVHGRLAATMQARTGVPLLEAFDIVNAFLGSLDKQGYSLLPHEVVLALNAAGAQVLDPSNGLQAMPDRAVLRPYLEELGWKVGERWTGNPMAR